MKEILEMIKMERKKGLEESLELEEEQNEDVREITLLTSTIIIGIFRLVKVFDRMINRNKE